MLYDIIVLEPFMSFCVTCYHVTVIHNIMLPLILSPKINRKENGNKKSNEDK